MGHRLTCDLNKSKGVNLPGKSKIPGTLHQLFRTEIKHLLEPQASPDAFVKHLEINALMFLTAFNADTLENILGRQKVRYLRPDIMFTLWDDINGGWLSYNKLRVKRGCVKWEVYFSKMSHYNMFFNSYQ